jgi:hypothetical protein
MPHEDEPDPERARRDELARTLWEQDSRRSIPLARAPWGWPRVEREYQKAANRELYSTDLAPWEGAGASGDPSTLLDMTNEEEVLAKARSLKLSTCRYADHKPWMGVAVRSSVGYPRYWRGPKLPYAETTAPVGIKHISDYDTFRERYFARLDELGLARVTSELDRISRREGLRDEPAPLVICCFEDLKKPGEWCHRRLFSSWWQDQTGVEVPEAQPRVEPPPQEGLF